MSGELWSKSHPANGTVQNSAVKGWGKLIDFRGLALILAVLYGLALVGIKGCLNFRVRFVLRDFAGRELRIAAVADSDGWEGWFYDSEFPLLHLTERKPPNTEHSVVA
jgi:hypothetical protein